MCGSGASRHTTSGGLSPRGKVASLSSREWGVVCDPSYSRAKMPGNPGTLGLGTVEYTLAMILQMICTSVSAGAGWNVSAGAVGTAGFWAGGNAALLCGVPFAPAWRACVGARLRASPFFAPCWGRCRPWSAWNCMSATEDAIVLMRSRIWSS